MEKGRREKTGERGEVDREGRRGNEKRGGRRQAGGQKGREREQGAEVCSSERAAVGTTSNATMKRSPLRRAASRCRSSRRSRLLMLPMVVELSRRTVK